MASRASWKGYLRVAELTCPVALHAAVSAAERIAFHTVNRSTGHPVHRQYLDEETEKPVPREDQVKGYETASGETITLEPDEVAAAVPDSDKTLAISDFIACDAIDTVYFDRPYYLVPADRTGAEAYTLIREGMRARSVAAIARTVLFRRVRTVLIRPHGAGMIATTLDFDYEVRSAKDAFSEVPHTKIDKEMLDLAKHIIRTKTGTFDPARFEDRYEAALGELVKAKLAGRKPPRRPAAKDEKLIDLMAALRQSAKAKPARKTANRRKAG
ncbi:MAG: Ku protein [Acidiphilium sp.]|nr:Ku protein [Acidiphilium sp.]